MTSITKANAVNTRVFPDVQFVGGPYYNRVDDDPQKLLFPFTFQNGTLEIQVVNGFNLSSPTTPIGISSNEGGLVRRMGGQNLVQSIGSNFQTYVQNCTWITSDLINYTASNVSVYKPGVVTRVQQLGLKNLPIDINPINSYVSSYTPPVSDFGLTIPLFGVTYVFEKPLVLVVDATKVSDSTSLGKQYITFYTSWDH
jgi:hypothetical protein